MTRAKDRLYLVHAHHRATWGVPSPAEASRFLAELPEALLAPERPIGPARRRDTWQRVGTDDAGTWLPSGYRSPRRLREEPLRPRALPDLAAPVAPGSAAGSALEAQRQRIAGTHYEAGAAVNLGTGTFGAGGGSAAAAAVSWSAGDRVRHRRYGEGIVVSSELVKGEEEVTVDFDEHGRKYLIAAYAGLERAG